MPSVLPPKLRWRPSSLPLLEAGLSPIERAQRIIAGSLTLWASRTIGFNWSDHLETEMAFRYCVARINGDREAPRPTVFQLRTCLAEVGDHIDAEAYQALNILALSIDSKARSGRQPAEQSTDFFGLDGEPIGGGVDDSGLVDRPANAYGVFGEPPVASFANSAQSDSRLNPPDSRQATAKAQATRPPEARAAARPQDARSPEPRKSDSTREPVDSLQDARDAHEAKAVADNPMSIVDLAGAALRDLIRRQRDERRR